MALDYVETSRKIIEGVGGADNIMTAAHCMTRLRLVLKDDSRADDKKVEQIKGVKSVIRQGGQYQIVIGNEVSRIFKEFKTMGSWNQTAAEPKKEEGNLIQRLFGFISGCLTPLIPGLLGCGMVKVVLSLLTTFTGMDTNTSTYIILNAMSDCFLYFLPIFLCYTTAKKMGGNPTLWMLIGAAMVYPQLTILLSGGTLPLESFLGMDSVSFLGVPVICANYTSSVLPVLLMAPVMKFTEDFLDRICPDVVKAFLKPMLFVLINVPIVLIVLGPLGNVIGNLLSLAISRIYDACGWLAVGILAAIMPFVVMTGMHYALTPIAVNSLASLGFDPIIIVAMLCANIAQGGAAFGVAAKTKNTEIRSEGIACGISAVIAGVTEPAMYGINLRYRKPMAGVMIGAGAAGLFCGLTGVYCYIAGGSPSFLALPMLIGGEEPMRSMIFGAIGSVISVVLSFVISFMLYKDSEEEEQQADPLLKSENPAVMSQEESGRTLSDMEIASPVPGEVIPMEEISDSTFASGVLGKGFGVIPSEGKVYAPFDGVCESIFDTLHALGLRSDGGVELLIHVGLDTVNLQGRPFKAHIKSGERMKKGQLLLEFDIDEIKASGCETVTPVLVTNVDDFASITVKNEKIVIGG